MEPLKAASPAVLTDFWTAAIRRSRTDNEAISIGYKKDEKIVRCLSIPARRRSSSLQESDRSVP